LEEIIRCLESLKRRDHFISIHGLLWDFRETGSDECISGMPLQGGEFPHHLSIRDNEDIGK
jgi:hypothetical protein